MATAKTTHTHTFYNWGHVSTWKKHELNNNVSNAWLEEKKETLKAGSKSEVVYLKDLNEHLQNIKAKAPL